MSQLAGDDYFEKKHHLGISYFDRIPFFEPCKGTACGVACGDESQRPLARQGPRTRIPERGTDLKIKSKIKTFCLLKLNFDPAQVIFDPTQVI